MAGIMLLGNGGNNVEVDGTSFRALRTVNRPTEFGSFGHYGLAMTSGTIAAALAANAVVFSFRWGDATRLCTVYAVRVRFQTLTPFTAATLADFGFDAYVARGFTASHTGGTAAILTTNSMKMRTNMGTTLLTDARISSTAALAGGTITDLSGNAFAASIGDNQQVNPAAATEEVPSMLPVLDWAPDVASGHHPLVLAQNEGFVIRNRVVWPLAGTGIVQVQIVHGESLVY